MGKFIILSLFLVVTVLSLSLPTEVGGYNSPDYPTRDFSYYPWRRFNPRKRMETDVAKNTEVVDGQVLAGHNITNPTSPIYYKYRLQVESEEATVNHEDKKSSANKERKHKNIHTVYGLKVLFDRLPVTFLLWPSAL